MQNNFNSNATPSTIHTFSQFIAFQWSRGRKGYRHTPEFSRSIGQWHLDDATVVAADYLRG